MVEIKMENGVARVFLARPEKANALTSPMLAQLAESIEKLHGDATLRAVVIAGRGKAFCGGADVGELSRLDASSAGAFVDAIHRVCHAIRALPVPVVAQLHGAAIGGGLEIAAACDLRVAAEGTKFSMPEVRLGIPSVVEAALLPRLMGAGRAAWLVLTGEPIDARRAFEWGLVEEVTADVQESTQRLLKSLLAGDRAALAAQKRLIQMWDEAPLTESIARSIELFSDAYRLPRKPGSR
jgi:enoyl-CoA hydratase